MKKLLLPVLLGVAAAANAGITDRLYDFTDAHYRANGVDPTKIGGRKQAPSTSAVIDTPFFSWQRNVRVIGTSGGYGANGAPNFFAVMGGLGPDSFTADAKGVQAKQIAEKYVEYLFPGRNTDPVGLGALRQSVVLDNSNGYFSANTLGLWLHVWISYTDKAFNTEDGRKMLADLKQKNGLANDGTPIIKTKSEIDNLFSKGFVTKSQRTDGLRYAICPIIRDPREGGIAKDAFLNFTKKADGTPLEPVFLRAFGNLQLFGTW
ncbi:MAG: hypothetical protein QOJ65_2091 [Fimbriimonadaceae bacterium]|jgi:hypothetical protein|nr:hypothetical protein [Fimbriimonadaceae bacterium]